MRTISLTLAALLSLALLPLLVTGQPESSAADDADARTLRIDRVHSSVVFKITHLGITDFYGRFNDISGEFSWDEANPQESSIRAEVAAASVDTNNERRDRHLRSDDFFDVEKYEKITFVSTAITPKGGNKFEVTGDLTLLDVTRPVTASVTWYGAGDKGDMGYRGGAGAEFTIKRSDFGMTAFLDNGMLGDEVTLLIGLEGVRK